MTTKERICTEKKLLMRVLLVLLVAKAPKEEREEFYQKNKTYIEKLWS